MASILVVDDEDRVRAVLKIMLESNGHEVSQAQDGVKALERVRQGGIDLVISDIRMDHMDGKQLLSHIRDEDLACPLIFITAYASTDSVIQALRLGADSKIKSHF